MIGSSSENKTLQIGFRSCDCMTCIRGDLKECPTHGKFVKVIKINERNWIGDCLCEFILIHFFCSIKSILNLR